MVKYETITHYIKNIRKYIEKIKKKDPKERKKIGFGLIILGIVGIILPIIPTVLPLVVGIGLITKRNTKKESYKKNKGYPYKSKVKNEKRDEQTRD